MKFFWIWCSFVYFFGVTFCIGQDMNRFSAQINFAEKFHKSGIQEIQNGNIQQGIVLLQKANVQLELISKNWRKTNPAKPYPANFDKLITENRIQLIKAYKKTGEVSLSLKITRELTSDSNSVQARQYRSLSESEHIKNLVENAQYKEASRILANMIGEISLSLFTGQEKFTEREKGTIITCLEFLRDIGHYELFCDFFMMLKTYCNDHIFLSDVYFVLIHWAELIPKNYFLFYQQKYHFISDKEIYLLWGHAYEPTYGIVLASLYQVLKKYGHGEPWKNTLGEYMSEYYFRLDQNKNLADKVFSRNLDQVYFPKQEDSLPDFIYAYAKLMTCNHKSPFENSYFINLLTQCPFPGKYPPISGGDDAGQLYCIAYHLFQKESRTQLATQAIYKYLTSAKSIFRYGQNDTWIIGAHELFLNEIKYSGRLTEIISLALNSGHYLSDNILDKMTVVQKNRIDDRNLSSIKNIFNYAIENNEKIASMFQNVEYRSNFYREMLAYSYNRIVEFLLGIGNVDEALTNIEMMKSRILLDLIRNQAVVTKRNKSLNLEFATNQKTGRRGPKIVKKDVSKEAVNKLTYTINNLKSTLRNLSSEEKVGISTNSNIDLKKIQSRLQSNDRIIEFYTSSQKIFRFIIDPTSIHADELESKASNVTQLISQIRLKLYKLEDIRSESEQLFEILFSGINNDIRDKNLLIIPHGILHYLPFQLLYDKGSQTYLIDNTCISYAPSLQIADYLNDFPNSTFTQSLVLADPINSMGSLPGAKIEGQSVAKQINCKFYHGKNASEHLFKDTASHCKMIHLATHGVLDYQEPSLSGILLSPDNQDDGIVTINEIQQMKLNADLVVLSACETGVGLDPRGKSDEQIERESLTTPPGDDFTGLSNAFLSAGARHLVASYWQVNDISTRYLMESFYKNLKQMKTSQALREAQLQLKKQKEYSHPYYWASFGVFGKFE